MRWGKAQVAPEILVLKGFFSKCVNKNMYAIERIGGGGVGSIIMAAKQKLSRAFRNPLDSPTPVFCPHGLQTCGILLSPVEEYMAGIWSGKSPAVK